MSALERLIVGVMLLVVLVAGSAIYAEHFGAERYKAGYDAAVAAGQAQRDYQAEQSRQTETDLRQTLAQRDAEAFKKDQDHAASLQAAQRRVRDGVDRLRCPASPLQQAAAPGDRPATAEPAANGAGPSIVPETAADLLGIAGDVASLVSRYDQVVERFDACRAVNAR